MTHQLLVLVLTLWMVLPASQGQADDSSLRTTITQSAERFISSWKERNAEAIAAQFTPQAEYIDSDGIVFHGCGAIEAEFAARFEVLPQGTLEIEILSIRPIAEGVVVEDGLSSFRSQEGGAAVLGRYAATHVRQADGSWLMASVRELDTGTMSTHDRLQSLAWLIGKWHEDVAGNVVTTEWNWSADGNYLISRFTTRNDRGTWTGEHRIGWDAERRQFRSWVFEATGGTLEGWWSTNDDGVWSVTLSGTNSQGVRSSGVMSYQPDGADAIQLNQTRRTVNGESLPDISHRIVRQPPAPQAKSE